jgi:outer membrane protein assembly factor BamB
MQGFVRRWLLASLLMWFMGAGTVDALVADERATASAILEKAGVKVGLCVHIGAGREASPGLTAQLASQSRLLVHGLSVDEASAARARRAIRAANMLGQASVEKVSGKRLPYVNDLCNLVVVEDMAALTSRGIASSELLRIMAPNAVLCVREKNAWRTTIKRRDPRFDDWPYPQHGADGNLVSNDRAVAFPLGLRWIAGMPKELRGWSRTRAFVITGTRLYTMTFNAFENMGKISKPPPSLYLIARDAMNGLPRWKIPLKAPQTHGRWRWTSTDPFAADGERIYVRSQDDVIIVDAATGKTLFTCVTEHPPVRLLVQNDVLVISCRKPSYKGRVHGAGTVEGHSASTGKRIWSLPFAAKRILAADGDGVAHMLVRSGHEKKTPFTTKILAADIKTGRILWTRKHSDFGEEDDLSFPLVGKGFVILEKETSGKFMALAAGTGKVLWERPGRKGRGLDKHGNGYASWFAVVDGLLWNGDTRTKHDPLTGEIKGALPTAVPAQTCVPHVMAGNLLAQSRGGKVGPAIYTDMSSPSNALKQYAFTSARGGCMQGMTPANGMFYTAPNNCAKCWPSQTLGFLAFGPAVKAPGPAAFESERPTEKGPAFTKAKFAAPKPGEWATYRGSAQRDLTTASTAPQTLTLRWRTGVLTPGSTVHKPSWDVRFAPIVTTPIVAGGKVFVAATDTGVVRALDAASGKLLWSAVLPARVNTAPTVCGNLCFMGCHDGWLYALLIDTGQRVWRTRIAPIEQRIVANGCVESRWPVSGSPLVHDGSLFVSAGRSGTTDGGVALMQIDAETGKQLWTRHTGGVRSTVLRDGKPIDFRHRGVRNGVFYKIGDVPAWNHVRLNAKDDGSLSVTHIHRRNQSLYQRMGAHSYLRQFNVFNEFRFGGCAWNDRLKVETEKERYCKATRRPQAGDKADDTEKELWRIHFDNGDKINNIVIAAGDVVLTLRHQDGRGSVVVVSAADGGEKAKLTLKAAVAADGLSVAGGAIYVALDNGEILRIGAK